MTHGFETMEEFHEALDFLQKNAGFPTFEQFAKDPDRYRTQRDEDVFISIAEMKVAFKDRVKNWSYTWRGVYKCDSVEQLQHLSRGEGYNGKDLDYTAIAEPTDGTSNHHLSKVNVRINLYSKIEMKLMGGVVANDRQ